MSTILDSLKKSSDKRDGATNNSLGSFSFSNRNNPSKLTRYILPFILISLTSALLYWGYNYLYDESENPTVSNVTTNRDSNEIEPIEKISKNKKTNSNHSNATIVPEKIQRPATTDVRDKIKSIRAIKDQQEKDKNLVHLNRQNSSFVESNDNRISFDKENDNEQEVKEEAIKEQKQEQITQPTVKLSLPKGNQEKISTKQKNETEISKQDYLLIYQLPFSIRKDLPQIKLNIHVFDESPENRLVIINGTKFIIGDMIDDQVLIKDIVKTGVLLEFNNHEFLVPN